MSLLTSKSRFFKSLAELERAGLPILKSLRQRHLPPYGRISKEIAAAIEQGQGNFSDLLKKYPAYFSKEDCLLIEAGEKSGRREQVFQAISDLCEWRLAIKRKLISSMLYPAFLYFLAALILPAISVLISGDFKSAIIKSVITLAVPFIIYLTFKIMGIILRILGMKKLVSGFFLKVPLIGPLIENLDFARFFQVYAMMLEAGIPVFEAVPAATDLCRNSKIKKILRETAEEIVRQRMPFPEAFSQNLRQYRMEPEWLVVLESGQAVGREDKAASDIAAMCRAKAEQRMALLCSIIPKVIYIIMVIYIAFSIVSFWKQLFSKIYGRI
jgi:type II secretory pathway component PulF